jgi:hypothetical protein
MTFRILIIGILAVGLLACSDDYHNTVNRVTQKMTIKVLKEADPDSDVPTDFTLLCIDGVKYLQTKQGGITVKYQANEQADPSAEECELK